MTWEIRASAIQMKNRQVQPEQFPAYGNPDMAGFNGEDRGGECG
jgi:hypothetical protein